MGFISPHFLQFGPHLANKVNLGKQRGWTPLGREFPLKAGLGNNTFLWGNSNSFPYLGFVPPNKGGFLHQGGPIICYRGVVMWCALGRKISLYFSPKFFGPIPRELNFLFPPSINLKPFFLTPFAWHNTLGGPKFHTFFFLATFWDLERHKTYFKTLGLLDPIKFLGRSSGGAI